MASKPSRKSAVASKVPDQIWLVCEDGALVGDVSRFLKEQVFAGGQVPSINTVDPVDLKAGLIKHQDHVIAIYPGLADALAKRIKAGFSPSMALSEISSQRQAVLAVLEKLLGRVTIVSPVDLHNGAQELARALRKRLGLPLNQRPKNFAEGRVADSRKEQQGDLMALERLLADYAVSQSEKSLALDAKFDALTLRTNTKERCHLPNVDVTYQSLVRLKDKLDRQSRDHKLQAEELTLMQNELRYLIEQFSSVENEEHTKLDQVRSDIIRIQTHYESRLQVLAGELLDLNAYCTELEKNLALGRIWRSPAVRRLIPQFFYRNDYSRKFLRNK